MSEPTSTRRGLDPAAVADLERVARTMDEAFVVPGTRYRIGWDGVLGLVPGIGDLLAALPALWIIKRGLDLGVSRIVLVRMAGNVLLESLIGTVPVLGDLFDFVWKANRRNVRLIQRYATEPAGTARRSTAVVGVASVLLVLLAVAVVAVPILVLIWLIGALGAGSV